MEVGKILLLSLLFCIWEVLGYYNRCPRESSQCRCGKSSDLTDPQPYSITCEFGDRFPNLTEINILQNSSRITFKDFTVSADWDFSRLRNFPNFAEISFRNLVNLSRIDWNWFSDRVERVTIISDYDVILGLEGCEVRSDINIDRIEIYVPTLPHFPSCLPPTTRFIAFSTKYGTKLKDGEHFLAEFPQGEDVCYKWPEKTSTMSLQYFEFDRIPPFMFCATSCNIKFLRLQYCRNGLHSFTNLPRTLTKLWLYDCLLQNQNLNLSNTLTILFLVRIGLAQIPTGLPPSLRSVVFNGNNITTVDGRLEHLVNLRILELEKNQLTEWPDQLPSSLESLNLRYNLIAFLPSKAFLKFKNLTHINLERNRLVNYPVDLPVADAAILLQYNKIRLIRGNYRYCNKCSVDIRDNPLVCNDDLFQFITWMTQHSIYLLMNGWCRPFLSSVTSSEEREEIFRFIDYYTTELGCDYQVDSLICVNKNLTTAPLPSPFSFQDILDLSHNQITVLPDSIYLNQTFLLTIALYDNLLREIPYGLPYEHLTTLWLRRNRITHVTRRNGDEFVRMKKLKLLDLGENLIKMVDAYDFRGLSNLQRLGLDSNPFDCQCKIFFFAMWIEENMPEAQLNNYPVANYHPSCETPHEYQHRPISTLTSIFTYTCMHGSCYFEPFTDVHCSYNPNAWVTYNKSEVIEMIGDEGIFSTPTVNGTLTITHSNWTDSDLAEVSNIQFFNIDLSHNLLTEFPWKMFGEFTEIIDISNNLITNLPSHNHLINYTRIKSINFNNNLIKIISPESVQTLHVVPVVSLQGNSLSCECEQRPLMTWLESIRERLLDNNTVLNYGSGIHDMICEEPDILKGKKMLEEANEKFDEYCPIPVYNRIHLIIKITSLALITVILFSILLNFYLGWKRKQRESQNIILGFKQLLSKEPVIDDVIGSNYKYDAFVSYANQEEDFVYELIKELEEKKQRKLSFHQRDFIAGLSIVDNIVECIGNSSRVILIISDDFIRSSWCQYEVQVALANMHKRRRGKLLVPILVQCNKNEEKMRGNTKTILSEIAAITAPSARHVVCDDVAIWKNFCDQVDQALPSATHNIVV